MVCLISTAAAAIYYYFLLLFNLPIFWKSLQVRSVPRSQRSPEEEPLRTAGVRLLLVGCTVT